MATLDLTTSETLKINSDVKKFLNADLVKVSSIPASKGIALTVQDYYGDDLEGGELKEIAEGVLEEVVEFVMDKFQLAVGRVSVKNLDTEQTEVVFNKIAKSSVTTKATAASTGETRDEVLDLLIRSRNSLMEAIDHLYDAKNLADRGVSKTIAQNIKDQVIDLVDGETTSAINSLRGIIKSLSVTTLKYEE